MSEAELKDWENIPCILDVDLEYPEELHDDHNDYPMAPEIIVLENRVKSKSGGFTTTRTNRLVPNLKQQEKLYRSS
jgi:hypothetical protein